MTTMQRDSESQRPGADVLERQSSQEQGIGFQGPAGAQSSRENLGTREGAVGSVSEVNHPPEVAGVVRRPAPPPTRGLLLP